MRTWGTHWELARAFERVPWLLKELERLVSPHNTPEMIVNKARAVIAHASEAERVAILASHPRIGADPASLRGESRHEQGHADTATLRELQLLNDEYEARFGFRFVVFVNGRSNETLIPVIRARLNRTRAEELATGIDEYLAIARMRLERQEREQPR
ncbi:MAG TPA: 2-oxo-4-hydroxy-4-carboxy-5-ureidoimidazoline decarboxylase [Candidatus Limnocylindria bacterium]|nr:2-oxo-4-hydroxy-4-carboxy-5-ureidoimidazoline decarboxylase [Candidatus Limnocylindria bacterium]